MTWRSATAGGDLGLVDFESRLSSQRALNSLGLSDDQADAILEPVFRDRRDDVAVDLRDDYDRVQGELFNDPEVAPSYEQFADSAFNPALRDDLKSFSASCPTRGNLFAGDTLVAMADGSMTPIARRIVRGGHRRGDRRNQTSITQRHGCRGALSAPPSSLRARVRGITTRRTQMNPLILAVALGGQLDELGIKYAVGGSVASSFYGEPRSTLDIDVAVQGDTKTLRQLLDDVAADFYRSWSRLTLAGYCSSSAFNRV